MKLMNNTKLDDFLTFCETNLPSIRINRHFYFDESNNIKKGIIGFDKDNNKDLENIFFTLGGIALDKPLDFDDLLKYVGARQTPVDAKFKFFSFHHTKFEEAIKQPRLHKFFEYLLKKSVVIHFEVFHYMHFALTDILDSLIEKDDINQEIALRVYKELQSDLTEVLYFDFDRTHDFLCRYSFPNIPRKDVTKFINELFFIYCENAEHFDLNDPKNFTKELLRQIIKAKLNQPRMIFLDGRSPLVITEDIRQNYLMRMYEISDFKTFDEESSVEKYLKELDGNYSKKMNLEFISSHNSREIQVCDVICGFVSKLYSFLSHNTEGELINIITKMKIKSEEFRTLSSFMKLMDFSDNVNAVVFNKIIPLFIEKRFSLLYDLIANKVEKQS